MIKRFNLQHWFTIEQVMTNVGLAGGAANMKSEITLKQVSKGYIIRKIFSVPRVKQGDKTFQYRAGDSMWYDSTNTAVKQFLQSFTGHLNLMASFTGMICSINDILGESEVHNNCINIPYYEIIDLDLEVNDDRFTLFPGFFWLQSAITKDVGTALDLCCWTNLLIEY